MGLNMSGDTADTAFYDSAEKPFIFSVPDPRIKYYGRFEDDIFIVFRGSHSDVHTWFDSFRAASSIFKLKLEEVGSSKVSFLDLSISKSSRWHRTGRPDIAPFQKPSSRAPPLITNSFHPRSQHRSWSLCRFQHYDNVSTGRLGASNAKWTLLRRLESHDLSHPSLSSLRSHCDLKQPVVSGKSSEPFVGTWIVLPYHPCWLPLSRVCAGFRKQWRLDSLVAPELAYLNTLAPRISWSRGGCPLQVLLGRRDEELVIA